MQFPRNCRWCRAGVFYSAQDIESAQTSQQCCVGPPAGKEAQPPRKELPASAEVTQASEKEGSAPARTGLPGTGQSKAAATLFEIAAKPCGPADSATEQEQHSSSTQPAPGDFALTVTFDFQACRVAACPSVSYARRCWAADRCTLRSSCSLGHSCLRGVSADDCGADAPTIIAACGCQPGTVEPDKQDEDAPERTPTNGRHPCSKSAHVIQKH